MFFWTTSEGGGEVWPAHFPYVTFSGGPRARAELGEGGGRSGPRPFLMSNFRTV